MNLILKADSSDLIKLYNRMMKLSSDHNLWCIEKYTRFQKLSDLMEVIFCFMVKGNFSGDNSYIGNLSTVQASKNCKVKIGNNTSISHNVRIYTSSNDANQI